MYFLPGNSGQSATTKEAVKVISNTALKELNSEIGSIVDKITPSVVNVSVVLNQKDSSGQNVQGVGAGIIYKQDGYIITNNHVAGDAIKITVTLNDGINYDAKLVGADAGTDIAVVKVDAVNLVPAQFASEDKQKVGDFVLAVGSPFGVQQTITNGIISGLDRNIPMSANTLPLVNLIQTDAPINPGNSGGPLVNINCEVIGMNTIGYTTSGSSSGIGFAIPADTMIAIADEIIKYGAAQIPYIGIEIDNNISKILGVLLKTVIPGGPAEKAGLKAGDIISEFAGEKILNPYDLLGQIIESNVGETVNVKYYRNGNYSTANIILEKKPAGVNQPGA
ncbi:MAG: trypsin-like peptidase domain-containing protein [Actinobacteria bacterium]|nr:trypsin-like peptidase domain-containing protein [Actinomycetota bacterium]